LISVKLIISLRLDFLQSLGRISIDMDKNRSFIIKFMLLKHLVSWLSRYF